MKQMAAMTDEFNVLKDDVLMLLNEMIKHQG
jgi:hypothetical protein